MDFVDGKRSFRFGECIPDRGMLARVPSFGHAEMLTAGGKAPEAPRPDPQLVQQWVTGLVSMVIDNVMSIA